VESYVTPVIARRLPWKRLLALTLALAAVLFGATSHRGSAAPSNSYQVYLPLLRQALPPIIPDTTVILTELSTQHLLSVTAGGSIYTFSQMTPELALVDVGDVVVAGVTPNTPYGFLRLVTALNTPGGQVVLTTVQATLEDAIEQGELHVSQSLSPDMVVGTNALPGVRLIQNPQLEKSWHHQLVDVILFDADGFPSTTDDQVRANGSITLTLDFDFNLAVQNFSLQHLAFTTSVEENASLEITAAVFAAEIDKEVTLASHELGQITVPVGPVPVVIIPEVSLVVGLDGQVYVGISTSVAQRLNVSAGAHYRGGAWGVHESLETGFTYSPPDPTASMEMKGYLGPELALKLYGVAGPYARVQSFAQLQVDLFADPWWQLWGGLELPVGVKVEVLGDTLADYDVTALDQRWLLAQAQDEPPDPGGQTTLVGAGSFQLGCWDVDDDPERMWYMQCSAPGLPPTVEVLDSFYIDIYEVSNARYAECVADGACQPPAWTYSKTRPSYFGNPDYAAYPVINITWHDAAAFCAWDGKRLPTEAEWEKAAKDSEGIWFPHGDPPYSPEGVTSQITCSHANYDRGWPYGICSGDTEPVHSGQSGASPYGALNMAGNVEEYVTDVYPYPGYEGTPGFTVLRGGSWFSYYNFITTWWRQPWDTTSFGFMTGFRCAADDLP
jgi:formylglycine-generating enzyme required for sulfatase activity